MAFAANVWKGSCVRAMPLPPPPSSSSPEPEPPPLPEPSRQFAPVNLFLIVGSVVVFVISGMGENTRRLLPLFISLYPSNAPECLLEVRHGEVWRLFTPAFIHFGITHLGFNMLGLKNVGDPMERVHGTRFYLFLVAMLALCSSLGQYFLSPSGSPYFGGMSGVLYGLFGYLWTRGLSDAAYPLRMPTQTVVIALVWFVACFTGMLGPIANSAHTTGLLLGAAWGWFAGRRAAERLAAHAAYPITGF